MGKRIWTELDYVAGAAHEMHMSYGSYVAAGMPNLERFKRQVQSGEFDRKRPRGKSGRSILRALADLDAGDSAYQKPRKKTNPVCTYPEGKCLRCGVVLPAEKRSGVVRKYCATCVIELKRERCREHQRKLREKRKGEKV